MVSVTFVDITARAAFLCELHHNVGSHESFTIKVMNSVLCILGSFKLYKAETRHYTAVDNAPKPFEKFHHIIRSSIRG
jgi:hypothetical protein